MEGKSSLLGSKANKEKEVKTHFNFHPIDINEPNPIALFTFLC